MVPIEVQLTEAGLAVARETSKKPAQATVIWPAEPLDDLTGISTAVPIEAISAVQLKLPPVEIITAVKAVLPEEMALLM